MAPDFGWLTVADRNFRTHLPPRSRHPRAIYQLGVGRMWRLQATVIHWTFRSDLWYLRSGGPPGRCVPRQVAEGGHYLDEPPDVAFDLEIRSPSIPTIQLCSHRIKVLIRAFSRLPFQPVYSVPLTRFALSIPAFIEFSQDHRLAVYAGAIYLPPPMGTRHWFDQPILAPYDDYVLDVQAFVIDPTTNQFLPILKLSAADPTDNFYADDQVEWDTESTFDGGRVHSKHLRVRIKRSFLSKIFTTVLLVVKWFLTLGCLRITLLSVVGHKDMGEGVLLLPITVIITIPALRQLYVGSPPFGVYSGKYVKYTPY